MGPLGELGALFNPGMRHEEEEKRAKQMLREEEGTGRKGRLGIDLESGVVVIGADRAGGEAATAEDDDLGPSSDDGSDRDTVDATDGRSGSGDGTAASNPRANSNGSKSNGRAPKPGEPQIAQRSPAAAPEGKARRRGGQGAGTGTPAGPVGKARRTPK